MSTFNAITWREERPPFWGGLWFTWPFRPRFGKNGFYLRPRGIGRRVVCGIAQGADLVVGRLDGGKLYADGFRDIGGQRLGESIAIGILCHIFAAFALI